MLRIVQAPNPVLSTPAKPVTKIDKSLHHLLKQMEEALISARDPEGVGLAAPQVGKSLQLFIIKQTPRSPLLVFINPHIESSFDAPKEKSSEHPTSISDDQKNAKEDKGVQLEGCLSLKDIWGVVKRDYGLILSYEDESGKKHRKKFEGFIATIIQHECDHLNGILFPKRVLEQKGKLYKSIKNTKGQQEFEEIEL